MQIKRQIRTLVAVLLSASLFIGNSQAMEKDDALAAMEKVYDATINSFYSINGFYNFSANQADKEQQEKVEFSIGTVEDLMIDIAGLLGDTTLEAQVEGAREAWLQYESSLKENIEVVEDTGYTDLRLVGDLATLNIALNDSLSLLYDSIASENGIGKDTHVWKLHKTGKTLALMMTKYSARSTSTVSQVYAREDTDVTLDTLATDFNKSLDELIAVEASADAAKLLDSAKTKWEFIEPSIINYNENRVNFIVNLYSRKIIEDLQAAGMI